MTPIGIGMIGCGDIARARFLPVIARSPGLALRGLHSRTSAVCQPLADQYGGAVYSDLDTMLRASEVEAVVIATPHPSHAGLAIRALEAGKHVLCEKPMATSLGDALRIEQAAERSQQVFMALPFDRSPAMEEAKRLIRLRRYRTGEHGRRGSGASRTQARALVLRRAKGALGSAGRSRRLYDQPVDLSLRAGAHSPGKDRDNLPRAPR